MEGSPLVDCFWLQPRYTSLVCCFQCFQGSFVAALALWTQFCCFSAFCIAVLSEGFWCQWCIFKQEIGKEKMQITTALDCKASILVKWSLPRICYIQVGKRFLCIFFSSLWKFLGGWALAVVSLEPELKFLVSFFVQCSVLFYPILGAILCCAQPRMKKKCTLTYGLLQLNEDIILDFSYQLCLLRATHQYRMQASVRACRFSMEYLLP